MSHVKQPLVVSDKNRKRKPNEDRTMHWVGREQKRIEEKRDHKREEMMKPNVSPASTTALLTYAAQDVASHVQIIIIGVHLRRLDDHKTPPQLFSRHSLDIFLLAPVLRCHHGRELFFLLNSSA